MSGVAASLRANLPPGYLEHHEALLESQKENISSLAPGGNANTNFTTNPADDNYKKHLNTYVSPTFQSSPLFQPEMTPPLYRDNAYKLDNLTNLPHLFSHEASIKLPTPPNYEKRHGGRPYPLNKKGNRAMALEDRFENDPKMYWIWPKEQTESLLQPPQEIVGKTVGQIKDEKQKTAWGTHVHEYAGVGGLTFLNNRAKFRDLDVARSHRHFLSGLSYSRHDKVTRSHITPFKKSANRQTDDLIPPASLIPLWKYARLVEQCKFVKEDKYASHKNRTEMFPLRSSQTVTDATEEAIKALVEKRYGQTTYAENFGDQRISTELKLGPQFQFYDSEPESDEEIISKTGSVKFGMHTRPKSGLNHKTANELPGEVSAATAAEMSARASRASSRAGSCVESSQRSKKILAETSSKPVSNATSKTSSSISLATDNEASWPAWPNTRCNHIDPVTLKIAEKTDVSCLQDKVDFKAIPTFKTEKQVNPDYKVPESIDHAPTSAARAGKFDYKFAPAYVDFAYSGYPGYYGCADSRANQIDVIDLKEKLIPHSKFTPLPANIQQNIDMQTGSSMYNNYVKTNNLVKKSSSVKLSESLEDLQKTIAGLREPQQMAIHQQQVNAIKNQRPNTNIGTGIRRVKISNNVESFEDVRARTAGSQLQADRLLRAQRLAGAQAQEQIQSQRQHLQLPPLWETLEYTSDRVIDQLGVKFKSAAQARYHEQFPESKSNVLSTPFPNIYLKQDDRHTTYRRQYYNGNHMGSSFR